MPHVMKAITIYNDSKRNKEQELELMQQPKYTQHVEQLDEDEDQEDQEDDFMLWISRQSVDCYLVSIIRYLGEYTSHPYRDTGLSE